MGLAIDGSRTGCCAEVVGDGVSKHRPTRPSPLIHGLRNSACTRDATQIETTGVKAGLNGSRTNDGTDEQFGQFRGMFRNAGHGSVRT